MIKELHKSRAEVDFYTTSSEKYSKDIGNILDFAESNHVDCQRIEHNFILVNMVRLKEQ